MPLWLGLSFLKVIWCIFSLLSPAQVSQFIQNGFLIIKQAINSDDLIALRNESMQQLAERKQPYELESTVQYPGAPTSIHDAGGQTIRRLLQAYDRGDLFKQWAMDSSITEAIQQLLQCDELYLNLNHHNTVMTKHPEFSSQTNWHRDTRYWHFNNKYLINSWLALGPERNENGGLLVLPGSHRWDDASIALDQQQFLIADHPANKSRLSLAQEVELEAGDCLLFSAHCFHAAANNQTDVMKYSLVYTYHSERTHAVSQSKSDMQPAVRII